MSVSNVSGHWTDEQLIEYLYGVGPEDGHLGGCSDCRTRLASMQARRRSLEFSPSSESEVSFDFLASQRRKIYARLTEPRHWWSGLQPRRLASAAAAVLVLGGGLLLYEENHKQPIVNDGVSDAQLAQEVSSMAENPEPPAAAPLQAFFEE